MLLRVGHGLDFHRFVVGRPLILGNVDIPSEVGLDGHSDADVLLHSVMDALLGATGRPDIGQLFPDTDIKYKNADSSRLFAEVWYGLLQEKWSLVNVDITLLADRPKLSPYFLNIKERLAALFSVDISRIGLKATTAEGMGFLGRKEGMVASSVVMIQKLVI